MFTDISSRNFLALQAAPSVYGDDPVRAVFEEMMETEYAASYEFQQHGYTPDQMEGTS